MEKKEFLKFLEDSVLSGSHYSGSIETIEYIKDKLDKNEYQGYLTGNIIKYISRCNKKGEKLKDLRKALTYLVWLIQDQDVN